MPAPATSPRRLTLATSAIFLALVVLGLTFVIPFLWQILISLSSLTDVDLLSQTGFPPVLKPGNYPLVFEKVDFAKYFFNSFFVAGWVTLLQVLTSSMAAYAFSRIAWPGRDKVFLLYLGTLMIPGVVLMVPNFAVVLALGMFNSYWGLIIPGAFTAYGTFLLRQFMLTIPPSLDEAASIDGAGHWRIFTQVILPLARPGLIVLAIFSFLGNYNSFFWPLILTKDDNLRTLPIGLLAFDSTYGRETPLIMAGSLMAMIPPILVFLFLQKYLVRGIQLGAVKG
ncbi:MAG: carbohydrate ABC transporter permease [Planctomycetota bacterium]|nr:carbohydrate ABC transporter permease [Planctomycetota bacterium]